MGRVAVLVDLSFFLVRYKALRVPAGASMEPKQVARAVWGTAKLHVKQDDGELYRILVYDCRPLRKKAHNPISKQPVDFAETSTYKFRTALHDELIRMRKVALRLGELADRGRWAIREKPTKALLERQITVDQLTENDVEYDVRQKGVDIKMGIDIASLAYKKLADCIVLITGDSDFVPAAKLARREGLDVVLDPLWSNITPSLNEHIDGLKTHWDKPGAARGQPRRSARSMPRAADEPNAATPAAPAPVGGARRARGGDRE
jgi:uncharacterized LabA/DUF88 family protein